MKDPTANQRKKHNGEKLQKVGYTFSGLQRCRSSSAQQLLSPKSAKSREILRKFELIAVQGHPRSLIFVRMEKA